MVALDGVGKKGTDPKYSEGKMAATSDSMQVRVLSLGSW